LYLVREFDISLTVHLGIILVNKQRDALFSMYLFISLLYTFRATQCSSSGEPTVSIHHLVYVTLCRWLSGMQVRKELPSWPAYQTVTYTVIHTRWCIDTIRFSWWWALGCSKHV